MNNESLDSLFSDIAGSLRTKLSTSDKIKPDNFKANILNIPTNVITAENIEDIDVSSLDPDKQYLIFKENWSPLDNDFKGNCNIKIPLSVDGSDIQGMLSFSASSIFMSISGNFRKIGRTPTGKVTIQHLLDKIEYKYTYDSDNDMFYLDNYYTEPIIFFKGVLKSYSDTGFLKYHKNNDYLGAYVPKMNYYLKVKSNLGNLYNYFAGGPGIVQEDYCILIFDFNYDSNNNLTNFKSVQLISHEQAVYYKSGNSLYLKNNSTGIQWGMRVLQTTYNNGSWTNTDMSWTSVSAGGNKQIVDVDLSGNEFIFIDYTNGSNKPTIYSDINKSGIFLNSFFYEDFTSNNSLEKLEELN